MGLFDDITSAVSNPLGVLATGGTGLTVGALTGKGVGGDLVKGIGGMFNPKSATVSGYLERPIGLQDQQAAADRTAIALQQQQNFLNALYQQPGGYLGQGNVFNQQQALANQLQQQTLGQGPNPAMAQLAQQTAANTANQAALMAGQRGAEKMAELQTLENNAFNIRYRVMKWLDLPRNIITGVGTTLAVYAIVSQAQGLDTESIGLMVLTLTYLFQIVRSVDTLPGLISNHDDLVTKIYPTLPYLTEQYEKIRDPEHPQKLNIKNGEITIENITFSYHSDSDPQTKIRVFENLSLKIQGRQRVGIVGLSGAGKSTLANLLLRFDEIESGNIKIDDIDIRSVKQSELRKNIAYVPQEPLLFHRSVRENIAYYSDASDAEIIEAAKAAHAHEFIKKLPGGYDTIVGERGIKLSGGQKQRVAIARAVLKKAPILLFDEATSALDSESEQIIQRALPEIIKEQTAIVIAHRLSTIAGMDSIIVMDQGKIVESGTHDELLKLKGRYYSLWQKQTKQFST
jgi:ABC-type multidrug transport system fused ATPase/permease subunit